MELKINSLGGGELFLPCEIGSTKTKCLIDSGATSASVSSVKDPSVKIIGKTGIRGSTGQIKKCSEVKIEKVMLGSEVQSKLSGTFCSESQSGNILGIKSFSEVPSEFNFPNKTINFPASHLPPHSFPLERSSAGHFLIKMKLGDKVILAVWDTGAGTSVINECILHANPGLFQKKLDVTAVDATGAETVLPIFSVNELEIGNLKLESVNFLVRDFSTTKANVRGDVDAIIGINVIRHYRWFFDPKKNIWAISQ